MWLQTHNQRDLLCPQIGQHYPILHGQHRTTTAFPCLSNGTKSQLSGNFHTSRGRQTIHRLAHKRDRFIVISTVKRINREV